MPGLLKELGYFFRPIINLKISQIKIQRFAIITNLGKKYLLIRFIKATFNYQIVLQFSKHDPEIGEKFHHKNVAQKDYFKMKVCEDSNQQANGRNQEKFTRNRLQHYS